ncbi:MAG: DUF998 domain-containing protein [Methanobacteriota archaeon]
MKPALAKFGPYLAILGSVSFSILWPLAALITGDWVLGRDTLSELGGKDNAAAPVFSAGCALAGACLLAFALSLRHEVIAAKRATPIIGFAAIGLVMVGVWNITMSPFHMIATVWFFASVAIGLSVLAYDFLRAKVMRASAVAAVVGIAATFVSAAVATVPFTEAVAVGAVIVWGAVAGTELLILLETGHQGG